MASPIRVSEQLDHVLTRTFNHASQPAFAKGVEVKFGSDDQLLAAAGTGDVLAIGITFMANAAGRPAHVAMYGHGVIGVIVGTGGATRGVHAKGVADGMTDAAANGGGSTSQIIKGQFLQTGVAGDLVELMIGVNPRSVTT